MVDLREITAIKHTLERMDNSEIEQIVQYANTIKTDRKEQRKKELWGNVVAAMTKYEEETGDTIIFSGPKDIPDFYEWTARCHGIIDIQ